MNQLENFYMKQIRGGILDFMTMLEKIEQRGIDVHTKSIELKQGLAKVQGRIDVIERQMEILSEAFPEE